MDSPINDDQIQIILNFGSCSDNSHDSDDEMAVLKIQDEADRFFLVRLWPASFSLMDPCNLRKDEAEKIRTYNLRYACANRRSRSLSVWRSLAVRELWLGRVNGRLLFFMFFYFLFLFFFTFLPYKEKGRALSGTDETEGVLIEDEWCWCFTNNNMHHTPQPFYYNKKWRPFSQAFLYW